MQALPGSLLVNSNMRRTRDRLFTAQPATRGLSSGLVIFEGEDLEIKTRTKFIQQTHKERFDQQIREKRMMQRSSKEQELKLHDEYMRLNSLFGQMEQNYQRKYRNQLEDVKNANLAMAREKLEAQRREKQREVDEDRKLFTELSRRRSVTLKPSLKVS